MKNFLLENPQNEIEKIAKFLKEIYQRNGKNKAVIAVSGGIDSALALTLVTKAIGKDNIFPVFLPFKDQSTAESKLIREFNQIPKENWQEFNIAATVESFVSLLGLEFDQKNNVRLGNIMARTRMVFVYDLAKKLDALVCGTENKSEKYLGYFTRFGDEASDIEPITHLYKAQVRQLAQVLNLPKQFLTQAPSAGLWKGQTDEEELGFSYDQADQVLYQLIDLKKDENEIKVEGLADELVKKIIDRVKGVAFKQQVPYHL